MGGGTFCSHIKSESPVYSYMLEMINLFLEFHRLIGMRLKQLPLTKQY